MTGLIEPYGGRLVSLLVAEERRRELEALPGRSVRLSPRQVCDLELLATGAFSPLETFVGRADHEAILETHRLANGVVFPIPITLALGRDVRVGERLFLRDSWGELLASLVVTEIHEWDRASEARALLGCADPGHPLVLDMASWGEVCVTGPLEVLRLPAHPDFRDLRRTPREVRSVLSGLGSDRVVAFQTRNPMHRAHEVMTKRAAEGATLLVHPVVGLTKPGDVAAVTRVRAYRALVAAHYDPARTLLSVIPLAMRMAGPREAVWHAIVRRNFGASHFLVGRDHAGAGTGSDGKPYHEPYAAQKLLAQFNGDIGVTSVPFHELVYLPGEDRYEAADRVPAGTPRATLSGTQVRTHLARGEPLPAWFTRPEVAAILADAHPEKTRQGFCVWLTGLPAAGKSTLARLVVAALRERGRCVSLLDGDEVRLVLSRGLGFSREDRDANIERIGFVAGEVVAHEGAVVCAAISPYRGARDGVRARIGSDRFLEVFVDTPLAVCEQRDPKGLYARARRGELKGLTGVDDPYEAPLSPEVVVGHTLSAEEGARLVLRRLEAAGFLG